MPDTTVTIAGTVYRLRDNGDGSRQPYNLVEPANGAATASASFSRPADTTAYATGDIVANSTTAGSVTALSFTAARVAPTVGSASGRVRRVKVAKTNTSLTNAQFRVHLYTSTPTIASGDNAAFSTSGAATYIGYALVTMDVAFTDGATGFSADVNLPFKLASGQIIYGLLEARLAYTPASAETFTVTLDVEQD